MTRLRTLVHGLLATVSMAMPRTVPAQADAPPFLRGHPATPDVAMRIYVPKGRVTVRTWSRDSIAVRGTIGTNARLFGGGDRGHVKLGVEALRQDDPALPTAALTLLVPIRARVWIKMIDGDLDVHGVAGELEAYAVRGAIVVQHGRGTTIVESIDATVNVDDVRGDLRVRGSKGGVLLTRIQGTASISTISGDISLSRSTADARIEAVGGRITLRGSVGGATVEVQTHGGGIDLQFDPASAPLLDLASRSGKVVGERMTGNAKHGRITARTFKGTIRVQRPDGA